MKIHQIINCLYINGMVLKIERLTEAADWDVIFTYIAV